MVPLCLIVWVLVWAVCLCVSGMVPLYLIVWVLCLCRMSVCIRYGPFMSDCVGSVSGPYVCVSGKVPLCLIVWVLCLGRMSLCIR